MHKRYFSTKTYPFSLGLSCCFRQWRAKHSHCQFLHGYALQVKLDFEADDLDERNWVVDFGGLKTVKKFLEDSFDHRTLVAGDDPLLPLYTEMQSQGLIDMRIVTATGIESFAEQIGRYVIALILTTDAWKDRIWLRRVTVSEHDGNSAGVEYLPADTGRHSRA